MLLLQSVAYALESGWIVLYVPRGEPFPLFSPKGEAASFDLESDKTPL